MDDPRKAFNHERWAEDHDKARHFGLAVEINAVVLLLELLHRGRELTLDHIRIGIRLEGKFKHNRELALEQVNLTEDGIGFR